MYTEYFKLSEEPFSIAANPRFLYLSEQHREALAHLHYGIRNDAGFVMLTGEVGTGKTTVCRCLIEQLPEQANVALILNPRVSVEELLSSICDEFHIDHPQTGATVKSLVDAINRYLLEQNARGRNSVIIVDEAQNLSFEVLEQLRLLTNLETNERKLLRIMLIGQPELETLLGRPELRQLEQRITARFCLQPLARSELEPYVAHRLALAGCRETVFPPQVIDRLYAETGGIPRLINVICDRAMLGAYVKSQRKIDRKTLDEAAREVRGRALPRRSAAAGLGKAALLLLALGAGVFYLYDAGYVTLSRADTVEASLQFPVEPEPSSAPATQVAMLGTVSADTVAVDAPPSWPDGVSASNNTAADAQAALFRLWGLEPSNEGADPCDRAVDAGLRCYSGIGNLGSLERRNRPAILTLMDDAGRSFPATLRSLDENSATIEFAHGVETVTRTELEKHWRGRFQMLWRLTPGGRSVLKPGDRGAEVAWLTRGLKNAGIGSAAITESYDAGVSEAVRVFQLSRGLFGDGIAGRQTLIQFNTVVDQSVPRLDARGEG